jgi:hypothetical protein
LYSPPDSAVATSPYSSTPPTLNESYGPAYNRSGRYRAFRLRGSSTQRRHAGTRMRMRQLEFIFVLQEVRSQTVRA